MIRESIQQEEQRSVCYKIGIRCVAESSAKRPKSNYVSVNGYPEVRRQQ